jgi:hypothetical protein
MWWCDHFRHDRVKSYENVTEGRLVDIRHYPAYTQPLVLGKADGDRQVESEG